MRARGGAAATLAVVVVMVTATAAAAHPVFEPSEAPATGTSELELQLAHGCGPDETAATTEVAVEVPAAVTAVGPQPEEGWQLAVEQADGRITSFTWTAEDGAAAEPAPTFTILATLDGDPGEVVYWRVFQGCDGDAFRWIGTPEEPADEPAVELVLTAETVPVEPLPTIVPTAPTAPPPPPATTEPTSPPAATAAPTPTATTPTTATPTATVTASPPAGAAGGGVNLPLLIGGVVVLALLAAIIANLARRRGDAGPPE